MKSGIIPYYIKNGKVYVLLMKPSDPAYGGSRYQIPKGMTEPDLSLLQTALKEGEEEVGLRKDNIEQVFFHRNYMMEYKKPYVLNIFLCSIIDKNNFDEFHYETGSTKWFSESQIKKCRKSHIKLLQNSINKVRRLNNLNEI